MTELLVQLESVVTVLLLQTALSVQTVPLPQLASLVIVLLAQVATEPVLAVRQPQLGLVVAALLLLAEILRLPPWLLQLHLPMCCAAQPVVVLCLLLQALTLLL